MSDGRPDAAGMHVEPARTEDGRLILYYSWPHRPPARDVEAPSADQQPAQAPNDAAAATATNRSLPDE